MVDYITILGIICGISDLIRDQPLGSWGLHLAKNGPLIQYIMGFKRVRFLG